MSLISRRSPRRVNRISTSELTALLTRIARADRDAFARLHSRLRPGLSAQLAMVPLSEADVVAVADATFVDIWRLAERCAQQETDAYAWVRAIAARRAGNRWVSRMLHPPASDESVDALTVCDRQARSELDALLARSPGADLVR